MHAVQLELKTRCTDFITIARDGKRNWLPTRKIISPLYHTLYTCVYVFNYFRCWNLNVLLPTSGTYELRAGMPGFIPCASQMWNGDLHYKVITTTLYMRFLFTDSFFFLFLFLSSLPNNLGSAFRLNHILTRKRFVRFAIWFCGDGDAIVPRKKKLIYFYQFTIPLCTLHNTHAS